MLWRIFSREKLAIAYIVKKRSVVEFRVDDYTNEGILQSSSPTKSITHIEKTDTDGKCVCVCVCVFSLYEKKIDFSVQRSSKILFKPVIALPSSYQKWFDSEFESRHIREIK